MTLGIHGFAFPFRIERGGVASLDDEEKLRANIIHILMTGVGERVMRRGYGGGLRKLVQDPNSIALWAVIQHQVGKSIGLLEPRVLLQQLTLSQSDDGATVFVSVQYVVRRTRQVQKLSVPIGLGGL